MFLIGIGVFVLVLAALYLYWKALIQIHHVPHGVDPMDYYQELKKMSLANQIGRHTLFIAGFLAAAAIILIVVGILL